MASTYGQRVRQTIAANVRRRRNQLGLTQAGAADQIGIATRHLQKLEAGELNVTLNTLCKVAETLDIPMTDLFREPKVKS